MDLYPYQQEAVKWLVSRRSALLALEMGLGKTLITLTALKKVNPSSVLVVCPSIAIPHWTAECAKLAIEAKIISYSSLDKLLFVSYHLLILDESHYLKSPDSQRTQYVFGGLIHKVKRCWCLSGTPAPNHAGELWPMMRAYGLTDLTYDKFIERYCRYSHFGNRKILRIHGTGSKHLSELKTKLRGVMYRKTLKDIDDLKLPPLLFETLYLNKKSPYSMAQGTVNSIDFNRLEEESKRFNDFMAANPSLNNISSIELPTLRRFSGLMKVEAVIEKVSDEINSGAYSKIVIFAVHQEVIERITEGLRSYGASSLYGKSSILERRKAISDFQTNLAAQVLVCNITTAGTAITLTASNQVLFVEQSFVPGDNLQAAKRCHRIGTTNTVFCRFATYSDSIDEKITEALVRKTSELNALLCSKS